MPSASSAAHRGGNAQMARVEYALDAAFANRGPRTGGRMA
jgi:hypothetical protein